MQFLVVGSCGGWTATFVDGNISMTDDTPELAMESLLEYMKDVLGSLRCEEKELGPEPARQLVVLEKFFHRLPLTPPSK